MVKNRRPYSNNVSRYYDKPRFCSGKKCRYWRHNTHSRQQCLIKRFLEAEGDGIIHKAFSPCPYFYTDNHFTRRIKQEYRAGKAIADKYLNDEVYNNDNEIPPVELIQ